MKELVTVSTRGQITLPVNIRRALGISAGGTLVVEEKNGELRLKPAAVYELDTYSDEQIANWAKEDEFAPGQRERIEDVLKKR